MVCRRAADGGNVQRLRGEASTASADLLAAVLDHQPTGVAVYRPTESCSDFLHVYVNPAFQR